MRYIDILGAEFDNMDVEEAVELSIRSMCEREGEYVLELDSQDVLKSRKSRRVASILSKSLLLLPADGGVYAAAGLLGTPLEYRMDPSDYTGALMARMSEMSMSAYILVSKPGIAQRASDDMAYRFPGIRVAGASDINDMDDEELINCINSHSPDLLVLSMDYMEQMGLIYGLWPKMDAGLCLGIGSAMDAYVTKRGESGFFRRLADDPAGTLKEARIILAALKKRIFG